MNVPFSKSCDNRNMPVLIQRCKEGKGMTHEEQYDLEEECFRQQEEQEQSP